MTRIRIKYKRQSELRYIGHLDMMRMWHRAIRRAEIPLAYSEGFNPHPKMIFAAPLALGVLSNAEFLDIYLTQTMSAISIKQLLSAQLPKGIEITQTMLIPDELPSMPATVTKAEFLVSANKPENYDALSNIQRVIEAESIPWEQMKDGVAKTYDIRQMIHEISLDSETPDSICIRMILRCDNSGSGRPEQVAKLLGLENIDVITRTQLLFN